MNRSFERCPQKVRNDGSDSTQPLDHFTTSEIAEKNDGSSTGTSDYVYF